MSVREHHKTLMLLVIFQNFIYGYHLKTSLLVLFFEFALITSVIEPMVHSECSIAACVVAAVSYWLILAPLFTFFEWFQVYHYNELVTGFRKANDFYKLVD